MPRSPHDKRLEAAGIAKDEYRQAEAEYEAAGLSIGYVPRKGWRAFGVPKTPRGPTYAVLWHDLAVLVHDRQSVLAGWRRMLAEWS